MKRNILLSVLTVLVSISILAQEAEQKEDNRPIEFHLTFINLGAEMHIPWGGELDIDLMMLGIEHKRTGLGIEFSPAHLYGWVGQSKYSPQTYDEDEENEGDEGYYEEEKPPVNFDLGWSIVNLTLYWNIMPFLAGNTDFYLAPFVEINYLVMYDQLYKDRFMFSVGLSTGTRRGDSVKSNHLSAEVGYRIIGHQRNVDGGTPNKMFIALKWGR